MALDLKFNVEDNCTIIQLKGDLNEYSSALNAVVVNPAYDLHIDLRDLAAINSLGIRDFVGWIHKVQCQRLRFFFCPRIFIVQLNMIDGFLPKKAEIESFFVPFYSEVSGEESMVLFTKYLEYNKVEGKTVLKIPIVHDSQGLKMELDVFLDQYFRFLDIYS